MNDKQVKEITSRDIDFAAWYTDVVKKADLVDYSSVKGSMIIRPYGYAIWENMQNILDKKFKETNHENLQMPMFIPESLLNVEKDHVEGFAPEVAWVTHGGKNELEERMCVRPTSETLFCEHFKKIISSYRDLPLLYNQWCTIVRWEKATRPFLRTREILWQEGHTMHASKEDALNETLKMHKIYEDFQKNILAVPVFTGKKTDKEKFAGAESTYSIEAMMYDGVALQSATSHYFGQGFAKAFDIKFLNKDNKYETPYQTSWGCTTRMIGEIIMVHGDDRGLVLPPRIAPYKVIIIPIGNDENVNNVVKKIEEDLKVADITYKTDNSNKTPGFKFSEAEVKGYPVRIEVGKRDLQNDVVTLVRRDTLEKIQTPIDEVAIKVNELLINMQNDMYQRALDRRNKMTYNAKSKEEFIEAIKKPGFTYANWCGNEECELKIKEEFGIKTRCIPFDNNEPDGDKKCVCCGNDAKTKIYFAKQY